MTGFATRFAYFGRGVFFAFLVFSLAATEGFAQLGPDTIANLTERLRPSVVSIRTVQRVAESSSSQFNFSVPPGSPLEELFRRFQQMPRNPGRRAVSQGSGFIISTQGQVVTNNHVIEKADRIFVVLDDGTELRARVLGTDSRTDLALLQIEASGQKFPSLRWGDSENLRIGEWVVAIGNPLGLGGSVTAGIVSARGRDIGSGPYDDFIQTDASINRGNSGGPLFSLEGRVVGINTAIFSPDGGSIGIGFSIPSAIAKPVIEELARHGEVQRGLLGVSIQPLTSEISEALGLASTDGVLIQDVSPNSAAERGGIAPGDVVLEFDGAPIKTVRELQLRVAETTIDKRVAITLWRDGRRIRKSVRLDRLTEGASSRSSSTSSPNAPAEGETVSGLTVQNLTLSVRRTLGIAPEIKGVLVASVAPDSDAERAGISQGMIITEIDRRPVETVADLRKHIGSAKKSRKSSVLMRVRIGDGSLRFLGMRVS